MPWISVFHTSSHQTLCPIHEFHITQSYLQFNKVDTVFLQSLKKKNSHSHGHCSSVVTEAAIQRYSPKKLLLKISLISQENECNWLWHWSFPVNFAQFLRTNIFRERLWWLLLSLLLTLNSYVNENVPPCASIFDYLLVYDMAITWLSRNHFLVKDPSIVNRAIFRIS